MDDEITFTGDADRLAALGAFGGAIAHQLNNSLSVVLNYSAFVTEGLDEADPLRADVERIHEGGRSAANLMRALLAFGARDFLRHEHIDLNARVAAAVADVAPAAAVDVRTELAPGAVRVIADASAIDRMLHALISNAMDAMPDGGTLTLRTGHLSPASAPGDAGTSATLPTGAGVRLEVVDTGEGFAEHVIGRAFEPFVSTRSGRRGLGLATVYGLVRQLGGGVTVVTRRGRGSTVRIVLPTAEAEPRRGTAPPEGMPGRRDG